MIQHVQSLLHIIYKVLENILIFDTPEEEFYVSSLVEGYQFQ